MGQLGNRDKAVSRVHGLRTALVATAAACSLGLAAVIGLTSPGPAAVAADRSSTVPTRTTSHDADRRASDDSSTAAKPNLAKRHHRTKHRSVSLSTGTGQTQATTSGS